MVQLEKIHLTDEQYEAFYELLVSQLDKHEISKKDLSLMMGKSNSYISECMKRSKRMPIDLVNKIVDLLWIHELFDYCIINAFKEPEFQHFYVIINQRQMFYHKTVRRQYVSYGKKVMTCYRFERTLNKAKRFATKQQALEMASTVNGTVMKVMMNQNGERVFEEV